jgi:multiple sugar transport system permease protein
MQAQATFSPAVEPPKAKRRKVRPARIVLYVVLIVLALVMAFPLLFGVAGSISTAEDYIRTPWFPIPYTPTLENWSLLLSDSTPVWQWVVNTLIRAGWYIVVPAIVAVMGGYALSKLKFRGRDTAFIYLLASLMLPPIVYLVPTYVMMARWPLAGGNNLLGQGGQGFINEWPALLITGWVNVFYLFMFRQTFSTIPGDFEEAARVDGAGTLRCLKDVYLPMLKPTLVVLFIFQFVAIWNDYLWPLFVSTGNKDIWTMSLGFQMLANSGNYLKGLPATTLDYPFLFALATFSILPLIIMYLVLQRFFVEGVQGFAIKG